MAHGEADPARSAARAAASERAIALIGPFRSADVAEAVEATAPARLPLIAPVATWAGVTRDDEPGCDDAARHEGTVLRLVARDTVVAGRLASDLSARGQRALVVAGDHDYGLQLNGQLRLGGLPRTEDAGGADVIVLAGLAGEAEVSRARNVPSLPVIAFDGIQGADLGPDRVVELALPFSEAAHQDGRVNLERNGRIAAELVVAALREGAHDRASLLEAARTLGRFDAHGDPLEPDVWLWRADPDWRLVPSRPL